MTDDADFNIYDDLDPRKIMDEHATLIGRVTITWNDVHDLVYHIFQDSSGLSEPMAKALFHTLRSDASQRDLTLSALGVALGKEAPQFKALKLIFNKIGPLAAARNEAIHTSWGINFETDKTGKEVRIGGIGKRPRHADDDGMFKVRFEKLEEDLQAVFEELLTWRRSSSPETNP